MREHASGLTRQGIAHHVRAAMKLGNCSRAIAQDMNKRRAKMGWPLIDLAGIETPAEIKLRKVKAAASLETRAKAALAAADKAMARAR